MSWDTGWLLGECLPCLKLDEERSHLQKWVGDILEAQCTGCGVTCGQREDFRSEKWEGTGGKIKSSSVEDGGPRRGDGRGI